MTPSRTPLSTSDLGQEGERLGRWFRNHWRKVSIGFFLVLFYILYNSYAERLAWDIYMLRREVEERRAEYLILRSRYLRATSQPAIYRRVRQMRLGLELPDAPPIRVRSKKESE